MGSWGFGKLIGWLADRLAQQQGHDLRQAEAERAELKAVAATFARVGHALLRHVDGAGAIAANYPPGDIEATAKGLSQVLVEFGRSLDEYGYLVPETDRIRLREVERDVELVRDAMFENADWNGPSTPEPLSFPEPGSGIKYISKFEGRLPATKAMLDDVCRRLSGVGYVQVPEQVGGAREALAASGEGREALLPSKTSG